MSDFCILVADTFVGLLDKLEGWKLDNDNYDILSIYIHKDTNDPTYRGYIHWQECEEIK